MPTGQVLGAQRIFSTDSISWSLAWGGLPEMALVAPDFRTEDLRVPSVPSEDAVRPLPRSGKAVP